MDYRLIVVPAIACALLASRPADAQELNCSRSSPRPKKLRPETSRRFGPTRGSRRPNSSSRVRSRTPRSTPAGMGRTARCRRPQSSSRRRREKKPGLRGKIVAKKTGEMKEELESAVALVRQYVPPEPDKMQAVMTAGTASLSQAGPGFVALKFPGYAKPGDALTLTFESAIKTLQQLQVDTWLDRPDNAVMLKVTMQGLARRDELSRPGGTEHPVQPDRSPDCEVQLPEGRAVASTGGIEISFYRPTLQRPRTALNRPRRPDP